MASINKTPNYGLNQWQGNEYPKRQDFVDDNLNVDAAIKAVDNSLVAHKADKKKYAKYKLTANQSIARNVYTDIGWGIKTSYNGEDFSEIDVSTGRTRIKILEDGMYQIQTTIAFMGSVIGRRLYEGININVGGPNGDSNIFFMTLNEFGYFVAGDLLNSRVVQSSDGALDLRSIETILVIRRVI